MLSRPFIKTVESGAQTTIFCAVEVFICKVILNLCKSLDWFHQYHPDDFFPGEYWLRVWQILFRLQVLLKKYFSKDADR